MVILTLIFYFICVFGFSKGTAPNITNILSPINVDEATTTETLLDVFKVVDDDGDNITSCTHTGDTGEFDIRQNSTALEYFEVYLLSSASLNYDSTPSYTLNVTCIDSAGETASETISIDVVENQAPVVVAPIEPVFVNESETSQRLIYTVNVTDLEGDIVVCNISGVSPPTTAFDAWKGVTDFEVYLLNNSNLDYNVASSYIITIVCSDTYGYSSINVTVNVTAQSTAPNITGIQDPIYIAEATATETLLDVFTVFDNDGDSITSCTHTGDSGEFDIRQNGTGTDNFELYILSSASLNYDVTSNYTLNVTCTDSSGETAIATVKIDVIPNIPPTLTAPTAPVTVKETESAQRLLYTVDVTDPENDTISCNISEVAPPATVFDIWLGPTDYEVYLLNNSNLDYSTTPAYVITIVCSDNYGFSATNLTVRLSTSPTITGIQIPINVDECTSTETLLDVFMVVDDDGDNITSCIHTGDSGEFDIRQNITAPENFELYLLSSANLDSNTTSNFTLNVTCTDSSGDTASDLIEIDILSNHPPTLTAPIAPATINENENSQILIYTVTVTEPEGDTVSCDITGVAPSTTIFDIWQGSTDYEVYLLNNSNVDPDTTLTYVIDIECSDSCGASSTNLTVNVQRTSPNITGILVPINVNEHTSTETLLDAFTVVDTNGDTITSCTHTGDNGEFDLRQNSNTTDNFELYILSSANLNYDNTPSFTLNVTCTDSAGDTATETITIDVIPNQAPTLVAPSAPVNVNENEVAQRMIYTLNVTDPEGDAVSCDITGVSPLSTSFGIWQGATDYEVYLLNNPNLHYDSVSTYVISIACSDNYGSSSADLTVDVEENAPPVFTNLPAGSNPSLDASSTISGASIYTVMANDTDSTTLTFSVTSSPTTPDVFQINTNTGEITTSRDLIYAVDTSYDLTVTVFDGELSTSEVLRVELTNVYTAPVITNLPDTVDKSEEIASGSSIFQLSVTDPDAGETISVTWSVSPSIYTSYFSLNDTTYEFTLDPSQTLDYELTSSFVFEFTVSDQKAATGPDTLTLDLINENEPCTFDKPTYYITTYEANTGGGTQDPGFIISDDDVGDSYTLSLVTSTYSDLFFIDSASGEISFDTDYDVDQLHPSNVTLTVQCADTVGETGTATLSVYVEDVNDNTPEFGAQGYIVYCDQYDAPGSTIDSLAATDLDSGDNGDVEYSWLDTSGVGSLYYSLNSNGAIILKVDPTTEMSYGDTYRFLATARDQGSPPLSSTTTVDVVYREVTTTTPTTTTTTEESIILTFWDEPGNIIWVTCAALLLVALLALVLYLLLRYCGNKSFPCKRPKWKCCKPKPYKPKTPSPRKLTPKPNPKTIPFEFWNDDDMIHRTNTPFTGKASVGPLPQPAPAD